MTAIAPGPQIFEIEPEIRPLFDRDLVVGMEVTVTASESTPQFIQHMLRRRRPESNLVEESDDVWLPAAIHTPPAITHKAEDPQSAVAGVVAALDARAAPFVMFTLPRAAVGLAGSAGSEFGTARG